LRIIRSGQLDDKYLLAVGSDHGRSERYLRAAEDKAHTTAWHGDVLAFPTRVSYCLGYATRQARGLLVSNTASLTATRPPVNSSRSKRRRCS